MILYLPLDPDWEAGNDGGNKFTSVRRSKSVNNLVDMEDFKTQSAGEEKPILD